MLHNNQFLIQNLLSLENCFQNKAFQKNKKQLGNVFPSSSVFVVLAQ